MEIVKKYWYIALGGILLLYFVSKQNSGPPILQQVGGSDSTTLALAQMASSERASDLDRQYGFASAFLNYDLQNKQVAQIIPLAKMQYDAQLQALSSQERLSQLSFVLQQNQLQQQAQLQNRAMQIQAGNQRREDWIGAITSGLQMFPDILGAFGI
jgi:hypothetical protein